MRNARRFTQLNTRILAVGISVLLATLLLTAFWGVGASNASTVESTSADRDTGIPSNGAVITIGVSSAMSPPVDSLGWPQANAAQLAVDQANAAGGVDIGGTNYTIALVYADSGCDPAQAVTAANNLLAAGVVAVVGPSCSVASIAVQPLYAAAGVAAVSPSTTFPDVTEQGFETTFRVISRDDSPAIMLANYLRTWLGLDRVAIVEWASSFSSFAADAMQTTFTGLGGTITSRRTVTSTADYASTLATIQGESPDVIFYVDEDADNAGLLSSIADGIGMTDVIIAWDTFSADTSVLDSYTAAAGTAAEGDHVGMHYRHPNDMPGYATFNAAYQAEGFANYGDEAGLWGAFAYDAANIIIAAIDRADSTDSADIRDEIAATVNYEGVVGTFEGFDTKGDVIPQWAWMERYQNGQWVMLSPSQIFVPLVQKNYGP